MSGERPYEERPAARPQQPAQLPRSTPPKPQGPTPYAQPSHSLPWKLAPVIAIVFVGAVLLVSLVLPKPNSDATPATPSTPAGTSDTTVSAACDEAMRAAAAIPGDQNADAELFRTAQDCTTVDEWTAALKRHPLAIGVTDASYVDPSIDLLGICLTGPVSPVCTDAREQGIITE